MSKKSKKLLSFMKPYKKNYFVAFFFSVICNISRAMPPFLIGLAISELARNIAQRVNTNVGGINFDYIGKIVLLIVIVGITDAIGDYVSNYLLSEAVQNTTLDLRSSIYTKLNKLPVSYYDSRQQGEILSRVTTDVTVISEALQQSLLNILGSLLYTLFSICFMFYLSPFFTIISLVIIPTCIFAFKKITRKSDPHFRDLQNSLGDLNGYTQEHYSGHMVIQLFGQEEESIKGFKKVNEKLNKTGFQANFLSSTINPILSSVIHLSYVALFLLLTLTVLNKPLMIFGFVVVAPMAIGEIHAFIQYVWQIAGPIGNITQLTNLLQTASASLTRVVEILDEKEDSDVLESIDLAKEDIKGDIEFKNVKFGYSEDKLLMNNINIDVKSGDTIAVVGPTGAGKTTLINLLMRFYDINGGNITIDGIDVNRLSKRQSRSLFGVVSQSPWLYSASIEDNIKFGKLDATFEEVIEAATLARADHFIRTLPDGYRTIINEESSNVSQGEKQLITIARALISDPEILILDEATSSVDTRLEHLLQNAMDEAMKGRTSFIIAHRLSTIRNADLILVMQHGSIVEQGNHDELIEYNGIYKDLYESQFQ